MTTRTITGRSTRNSRNAGSGTGIAFSRTIPPRVSTPCRLPSIPPSESRFEELGSEHGDGNHGDEDVEQGGDFGDGNPNGPGNDPPDDNGPGDHHDDEDPYDDENQPNLADAIAALARNVGSQRESSRTKVREPDPFDGTDPAKLRTFLVQLQLSFNDRPSAFGNGRRKVNFAISYLKGMALAYFETSLLKPNILNPPAWEDDYSEFVEELKLYFGSSDLIGESESKIENLTMKSSQRIAKYIVKFNRLATITGWDGCALRHQFYRSLPSRIKDELARIGKPATLPVLKALAQSIDSRYWQREEETRRECGNQPSDRKNDKPQNQASSSSNNNNNNNSNNNKNKNKKPNSSNNESASQNPERKKKTDLGEKLGQDGKLTPAERSRRFANNLCLFCGGVGHTAKDCSKAAKAKGRAAQVTSSDSKPAEDAKKIDSSLLET